MDKFSDFISEQKNEQPYDLLIISHDGIDDVNETGPLIHKTAQKMGIKSYLAETMGAFMENTKSGKLFHSYPVNDKGEVVGAVVDFTDMSSYGSGGTATSEKNAAGFRLLAIDPAFQGRGVGRLLSQFCIDRTKELNIPRLLIHSTESMKIAWGLYERLGFQRYENLDFMQGNLEVFGFQMQLG